MERYELVEGKSSKFWEAAVEGNRLTVRFGRIGTQGQTKEKDFDSAEDAEKEKKKLVKEKTGKGYVPAMNGAAAPAASAPPKPQEAGVRPEMAREPAPAAAEDEASAAMVSDGDVPQDASPEFRPDEAQLDALIGKPLATRSRPHGSLDAASAWAHLLADLRSIKPAVKKEGSDAFAWLEENVGETGPKGSVSGWLKTTLTGKAPAAPDAAEAQKWIARILLASGGLVMHKDGEEGRPAGIYCLRAFLFWLSATGGVERVIEAAAPFIGVNHDKHRAYDSSSWSKPFDLALRDVLTSLPQEDYERAIGLLTPAYHAEQDWPRKAAYSFILADDRPVEHDLKPLAVIHEAAAAGQDIGASLPMVPLLVDAPAATTGKWRTRRSYFMYYGYFDVPLADIAASVIANARHHGEPAVPLLDWLLHYGYDAQRTQLARVILATGEDNALAQLLPYLHEKWIRAALDEAMAANPALGLRQHLAVLAGGRNEPVVRARVMDLVKQYPAGTLRAWAGEGRPLAQLEKLLEAGNVPLAPPEKVPMVLRDPPWRKKAVKSEDRVLDLAPIATPFRYHREGPLPEDNRWRLSRVRTVKTTEKLIEAIREFESKALPAWYNVPRATNLPQRGDDEEKVLGFVSQRVNEIIHARSYGLNASGWNTLIDGLESQPDGLALTLWGCPGAVASYFMGDIYPRMMERFGERALPGLLRQVENDPVGMLDKVRDTDAAEIAPLAARALLKLKKARLPAMQWLRNHRPTAITRLIPDAVGRKGAARDAAEHTLRWLAADGTEARTEIETIARAYEAQSPDVHEALAEVLDRDPLGRYPARIGKLPAWFKPASLTRPVLKDGGALADETMTALAEMISFSTPEAIYAGIDITKEAATADSLARFSWDLFSAWLAEGAPGKDGWALRAIGWLGDDECARQLTRLIRKWPGESAHQRAVTGLDVLADIGTDVALMNLNGIAEKLKFKGLQERAREKIAALAEARDLTPEELADRLAPDLDLDEHGGLELDFGPRRFRVGFDEFLKPWVKDETGKRLKDLPKPLRSDDAERSAAAVKKWSALKKDARAVASLQIARLENMLSTSRRVAPAVFWTFFASHPLIRHLSQRLVWGVYDDRDPRTTPTTIFRVSDDLSVTDAADDTLDLDFSVDAPGAIGLVHPLHLPEGGLDAWGALFGDYEISQPFPQLGREIHMLDEAEKSAHEIGRFENLKVESARIRGMAARGWQLGAPQDSGCIWWLERPVRFADGTTKDAMFYFGDGLFAGAADLEDKHQTLGKLSLESLYGKKGATRTFGDLDPVTASEMLRGLALLAETAVK
ncbi:DUF4132 domain-containing protein [Shinella yambaruensis]|uniref:WGR and DUF4132 domain-containing protein n=1 Tax=Shinella yambaruensis TaxID=415996 RepID=UPI003D7A6B8D